MRVPRAPPSSECPALQCTGRMRSGPPRSGSPATTLPRANSFLNDGGKLAAAHAARMFRASGTAPLNRAMHATHGCHYSCECGPLKDFGCDRVYHRHLHMLCLPVRCRGKNCDPTPPRRRVSPPANRRRPSRCAHKKAPAEASGLQRSASLSNEMAQFDTEHLVVHRYISPTLTAVGISRPKRRTLLPKSYSLELIPSYNLPAQGPHLPTLIDLSFCTRGHPDGLVLRTQGVSLTGSPSFFEALSLSGGRRWGDTSNDEES